MSITTRRKSKSCFLSFIYWGFCLLALVLIAPLSLVLADEPPPVNDEQASPLVQKITIDPVSGLVYGVTPPVSGIAMSVDADGHPHAFCADPADSLAPAKMRDALQSDASRVRYE